jgi:hypothetical protein
MIMFRLFVCFLVFCCSFCGVNRGLKSRLTIDERNGWFFLKRQRQYEVRSSKLKQQERKALTAQERLVGLNREYGQRGGRFCNISLANPHTYLSYKEFKTGAVTVTAPERNGNAPCTFLGAVCSTESPEHLLVSRYIRNTDVVLEVKYFSV